MSTCGGCRRASASTGCCKGCLVLASALMMSRRWRMHAVGATDVSSDVLPGIDGRWNREWLRVRGPPRTPRGTTLKRSTFSEEQIAYAPRRAERGNPVCAVRWQIEVSAGAFYVWKQCHAHLSVREPRRLRQHEEDAHAGCSKRSMSRGRAPVARSASPGWRGIGRVEPRTRACSGGARIATTLPIEPVSVSAPASPRVPSSLHARRRLPVCDWRSDGERSGRDVPATGRLHRNI